MRLRSHITAIVASALCAAAIPAWAQSQGAPEEAPNAPAAPPAEQRPVAHPTLSEEQARQQHLNGLFDELADPDNPNWKRTAAQIWAAWNVSGSDSMDLLAQRADKAVEAKDYETALLHLNDLVRLAPDFAEGWNKRATVHFSREDYGKSLNDIAETLKREPRHFGALSGLGIILDRLGDKEGALEAYRRAVKLHPNLPGIADGIKKLSKEVEGQRL